MLSLPKTYNELFQAFPNQSQNTIMRVAIAGSNGLACSIADAITTNTYHQIIILSRAVSLASKLSGSCDAVNTSIAKASTISQRMASGCGEL